VKIENVFIQRLKMLYFRRYLWANEANFLPDPKKILPAKCDSIEGSEAQVVTVSCKVA
jgi:hypothetical protein